MKSGQLIAIGMLLVGLATVSFLVSCSGYIYVEDCVIATRDRRNHKTYYRCIH